MRANHLVLSACILAFGATTLHARPTSAASEDENATAGLVILLSTSVVIALAGIGSYALTSKDKGGDRAARYLRENALDVRQGIAQGEGPVVDDLAAAFRVDDSRRLQFVRGLRAARIELFSLAEPASLTDERALLFLERVRAVAEAAAA